MGLHGNKYSNAAHPGGEGRVNKGYNQTKIDSGGKIYRIA